MKQNFRGWLSVATTFLVSILLLGACASTSTGKQLTLDQQLNARQYEIGASVDRIRNYRLHGWSHLGDGFVIMHAGVNETYLVGLRPSCRELEYAREIAFTTTVGSLTTADKLMVNGPGGMVDHCLIRSINRLNRLSTVAAQAENDL